MLLEKPSDAGQDYPLLLAPFILFFLAYMKKFLLGLFLFTILLTPTKWLQAFEWVDVPDHSLSYFTNVTNDTRVFSLTESYCAGLGGRLGSVSELQSIRDEVLADTTGGNNFAVYRWTTTTSGIYHKVYKFSTNGTYDTNPDGNSQGVFCVKNYSAPSACTSWTYSAWGACDGTNVARTVLTSSPSGCAGGSPVLSQACDVCTSWTYSVWSSCSNDIQTRTILTSSPNDCINGSPLLSQSCFTSDDEPGIGIIGTNDSNDINTKSESIVNSVETAVQENIDSMILFFILLIGCDVVFLLFLKGRNAIKKA